MPSAGILVLGMHRSGTSALAGALNSCGAFVGLDDELIGPNIENTRGFFERRDIRRLCDSLLFKMGADWWKLSAFDLKKLSEDDIGNARFELKMILKKFDNKENFVIKEPRLTILLPIFLDLFKDFHVIIIHRNPIAVAQSLRKRNAISLQQGLHLWEYYNLVGLRELNRTKYSIVSYEDLLALPHETMKYLINKINSERPDVDKLTLQGYDTIERSMNHSQSSNEDAVLLTQVQRSLIHFLEQKDTSKLTLATEISNNTTAVLNDLEYQYARLNNIASQSFFGVDEHASPFLRINSRKIRFVSRYLDQSLNKIQILVNNLMRLKNRT